MSSRFSRRSTRVQPKPKVCKSIPVIYKDEPDMFPDNITLTWEWFWDDGLDRSSIAKTMIAARVGQTQTYHLATFDDEGQDVDVRIEVNLDPTNSTFNATTSLPAAEPVNFHGMWPGWDGTRPYATTSEPINADRPPGGGAADFTID